MDNENENIVVEAIDFASYKSEPREFSVNLPTGEYPAVVLGYKITDDRIKGFFNPVPKAQDELPEWSDPTPQLLVAFKTKSGVAYHRYQGAGYKRFSELDDPTGFSPSNDAEGYAMDETTKARIKDAGRTKSCQNILAGLFAGCGCPEGSSPDDLIGKNVVITVKVKEYADKHISEVTAVRPQVEKVAEIV